MIVGEAPGYHEVKQKRPFVGKAGRVLNSVLEYVGVKEYYLTNTVKCRPPENRNPTAQEVRCCLPILQEEVEKVRPKVIVTLGAVPSKVLFPRTKLQQDRGKLQESIFGISGVATYHPAATLYKGGDTILPYILGDIEKAMRVSKGEKASPYTEPVGTEVITITEATILWLIEQLNKTTAVSMDWETLGSKPEVGKGICVSMSWEIGQAVVIPENLVYKYNQEITNALKDKKVMGYNSISFDTWWNYAYGIPVDIDLDFMLIHYLTDERPQRRSLENLTVNLLDAPPYESEMMAKYQVEDKGSMPDYMPMEEIYYYAGLDADYTFRLGIYLTEKLSSEAPQLIDVYKNLLKPAAKTISNMENNGIWVDQEQLERVRDYYKESMESSRKECKDIVGDPEFNPNSYPQVRKYVWGDLQLEEPKLYGKKPGSTDKEVRKALLEKYPEEPFIRAYDNYQEYKTMFTRYLKNLGDYIESDGRIRCNYHLDRTETGRLSTTAPAIHQIPRESEIRGIFAAPPGFSLVQADYEQIEIRMAAHIADDDVLIELLHDLERRGTDFHTMMASQAFRVGIEEVTKDMRQAAKAFSFGILYLMTDDSLASSVGMNKQEAKEVIRRYKEQMPYVQDWIIDIRRQVIENKYVVSPFGRYRRFPLVTTDNIGNLHKEAVNFPIQSGASDLTLTSLVDLEEVLQCYKGVKIVGMVHDSALLEIPNEELNEVSNLVKETMENNPRVGKKVPFPVEVKAGERWG